MGRVYAIEPAAGERSGMGYRFFTHTGEKLRFLTRVEFPTDADEGIARVTGFAHTAGGTVLFHPLTNEPCRVEFTTWVRAVPRGQPDPPHTPDAVLYDLGGGDVRRFDKDPLPDEVLAALNAAGAATE